jgi:tetratricopeptide (TPR) repeat protein
MGSRPGVALTAILIASLALVSATAAGGETGSARPEVARALFDEARQSSELGDWEQAAACLEEAALQDPGDSDILYLRALSIVKRGLPYAAALGDLGAALATDRFASYSRREARVLKAELLVRERRWKEALDALGSPNGESSIDPVYSLVRARAFMGEGNQKAFLSEIGEGLRRFPDDAAFPRLFISRAGKIAPSDASKALAGTILGRLTRYASAEPELPVLAAPLMSDLKSRRDAVLAYRATGGSSPKAGLRALEYGIIDERTASAEILAGRGPVALEDISDLMALAGSPDGRESVRSALASWTGEVIADADSDGVYECRFALAGGLVREWSRDTRQEGLFDERANFVEGMPSEITLERADREIRVEYSGYPAVSTIAFVRGGERRSYAFAPDAYSFAPIALSPFAGSGRDSVLFPGATGAIDPTERSAVTAALSVEIASGDRRELVTLDRGLPVSAVTYVGGRLFSSRSYAKGRPVLERVDSDGDGRFETEKGFVPDRGNADIDEPWPVAWIRIDADGDGVFEYREQTIFPYSKEWDYDGNGCVDAKQETLRDGSIKGSYSSRLDGRLDEEIVVKNGKIVSVARNGVQLALIPDADRQLTWIGRKSFDLGSTLPAEEGIYTYMGKRYRLTKIGAKAFAELIP